MQKLGYPTVLSVALRSLVKDAIEYVQENGLPEKSYFIIGFSTEHPGSDMSDALFRKHPKTMKIIIQEWYEKLNTGNAGFSITLNFSGVPENIYVPYHAITYFTDPGMGLEFEFPPPEDINLDTDSLSPVNVVEGIESYRAGRSRNLWSPSPDDFKGDVYNIDDYRDD